MGGKGYMTILLDCFITFSFRKLRVCVNLTFGLVENVYTHVHTHNSRGGIYNIKAVWPHAAPRKKRPRALQHPLRTPLSLHYIYIPCVHCKTDQHIRVYTATWLHWNEMKNIKKIFIAVKRISSALLALLKSHPSFWLLLDIFSSIPVQPYHNLLSIYNLYAYITLLYTCWVLRPAPSTTFRPFFFFVSSYFSSSIDSYTFS